MTVLELAISMTIVGLLIGGVLVGRSLIDAADARSILTDVGKVKVAVELFRDRYNCIPGDCPNITTRIPTAANDGDGNKQIQDSSESLNGSDEHIEFFQHIQSAGLLMNDNYNPANVSAGYRRFFIDTGSRCVILPIWTPAFNANAYHIAGPLPAAPWWETCLTPSYAYYIEDKLSDDKLPDTGVVRLSNFANSAACKTGTKYNLSNNGRVCNIMMKMF